MDGTAPHSVGFEGFSCPTPLSTQLWQYVTGFGIFWVVRNSKRPSTCLTPEEKMQEYICSNHHLAFSIGTGQNPSSLLSAERAIFLGSNTSCNKQRTETLMSPQPAGPWRAVYANRLLRLIQSKTGTNLVQNPTSSQAPEAK